MEKNKLTPRLSQIIVFLREAEKLKLVERIPYLSDRIRRENDAEHSWYLALILLSLEGELGVKFDALKTYQMIIVHDLVEVYTGDDWVYDKGLKERKRQDEIAAAQKLFSLLPEDLSKKFYDLWQEYDSGKTVESKIAKGIDKISYTLQYAISHKIEWHGIKATREANRNYALPYLENNDTLLSIFDVLLDETPEEDYI
jgi:putative hydrolase of HD superfamily